jgi:NADPH:quinone reductase-like Zn-dependent oxidoreductase
MSTLRRLLFTAAVMGGILPTVLFAQSVTRTMKAVVIHEYGGPEVLKYEDIARPAPSDDQLLIRVIAAGVNPVDGMIRSGMFDKEGKRAFPIILGGDVAGVVKKVGSKVTKFNAGDPVFAYVSLDNSGGYA